MKDDREVKISLSLDDWRVLYRVAGSLGMTVEAYLAKLVANRAKMLKDSGK